MPQTPAADHRPSGPDSPAMSSSDADDASYIEGHARVRRKRAARMVSRLRHRRRPLRRLHRRLSLRSKVPVAPPLHPVPGQRRRHWRLPRPLPAHLRHGLRLRPQRRRPARSLSLLFAVGYGLAAFIYRKVDFEYNVRGKPPGRSDDWSYPLMVFAFVCVGSATCSMYIASVSTCAKNFGKGKYRGLALAMPVTGFGLSGMWLSQVGSRFLYETRPDGSSAGVDVFRFIFLAVLLFVVGIVATFTLRVVDEQDLIEESIEELEQSGVLDGSAMLGRADRSFASVASTGDRETDALLDTSKDDDDRWRKNWVLNAETRRFLTDHTMWPFALAFLLMIGPGEAFVNNLGTVIGTLTPPAVGFSPQPTAVATHVSIFGVTSTIARLLIGTLTDLVAPAPESQHLQVGPHRGHQQPPLQRRITVSRVVFMLFFAAIMSIGLVFLASGAVQDHAERFWVVSGLVGTGYGAVFSLTPLIVAIIWGVENFATNFSIIVMLPALGSTFWGLVYSGVYQAGAEASSAPEPGQVPNDENL